MDLSGVAFGRLGLMVAVGGFLIFGVLPMDAGFGCVFMLVGVAGLVLGFVGGGCGAPFLCVLLREW